MRLYLLLLLAAPISRPWVGAPALAAGRLCDEVRAQGRGTTLPPRPQLPPDVARQRSLPGSKSQFYIGGMTPLMGSCMGDEPQRVEQLLKGGAKVNARDSLGRTALFYARSSEVIRLLIEHGAHADIRDKTGDTALIAAAAKPDLGVVKALLAENSDPDLRNNKGMTALMFAAQGRLTLQQPSGKDVVRALLASGADPDIQDNKGVTALMRAAESGQNDIVRLLLAGGADVTLHDKKGRSALNYALHSRQYRTAALLRSWIRRN